MGDTVEALDPPRGDIARDAYHVNCDTTWFPEFRLRASLDFEGHGQRDRLDKMKLSPAFWCLYGLLCLSLNVAALAHSPQAVNLKLLEIQTRRKNFHSPLLTVQDSNGPAAISGMVKEFPEQWFTQPVDHFAQDSPTFGQRYWVNKRHYIPGTNAPVIAIDGGETSGENRIPFLDTGIADILAKATGGIGVVLEDRYVLLGPSWRECHPSDRSPAGTMVSFLPLQSDCFPHRPQSPLDANTL